MVRFNRIIRGTNLEDCIRDINVNYKRYKDLVGTGKYERALNWANPNHPEIQDYPVILMQESIPYRGELENYQCLSNVLKNTRRFLSESLSELPDLRNEVINDFENRIKNSLNLLEERCYIANTFNEYTNMLSSFAYHLLFNERFMDGLRYDSVISVTATPEENFYNTLPTRLSIDNLDEMKRAVKNWGIIFKIGLKIKQTT